MRRLQAVLMVFVAVWTIPHICYPLTWEFNTDGNPEGWRTKGDADGGGTVADLIVEKGIMRVPVEKWLAGARLISPRMKLDASLYDRLVIRVRTGEGNFAGGFLMNWRTEEAPSGTSPLDLYGQELTASLGANDATVWTEEWQEFHFTGFVERTGWTGEVVRFDMAFGFASRDPEDMPEEMWIDSITLTGMGAELAGDPGQVLLDVATGNVFEDYVRYRSAGAIRLMAGDVDGDGDVDLVVSGSVQDRVLGTSQGVLEILLNRGDGTFPTSRMYYVAGDRVTMRAMEDMDGDGDPDLIANTATPPKILIFENVGDGRFRETTAYVADGPLLAGIGDFDGDGDMDIALSALVSGVVSVLWNEGEGGFTEGGTYAVGGYANTPTGVDLDGDGDVDLVVPRVDAGGPGSSSAGGGGREAVVVLFNDGYGAFGDRKIYRVGSVLAPGDFDEDGSIDLAVAGVWSKEVTVLLNRGEDGFVEGAAYAVGDEPTGMCVGDFNEDGHIDLAIMDPVDVDVRLLVGRGDGAFVLEGTYPVSGRPSGISAADLDLDGDLDLAVVDVLGENVCILLNRTRNRTTFIEEESGNDVPERCVLRPSYPNPFNASTTVRYSASVAGRVRLCIYDMMGQQVRTLVDETKQAGQHRVVWNGRDDAGKEASSGVYVYQLKSRDGNGTFVQTRKMLLMR